VCVGDNQNIKSMLGSIIWSEIAPKKTVCILIKWFLLVVIKPKA
jgi:hypothetical protein